MLRQAKTRRNRQTFSLFKVPAARSSRFTACPRNKGSGGGEDETSSHTHTHAAKKPQFLSFSEITYVAENHKTKSSATAALLPNATWNAAGGVERDSNNVMWIEMFFLLFSLSRFHPEGRV